jgi:hypothetical protein
MRRVFLGGLFVVLCGFWPVQAATTIFSTGFEPSEGYNIDETLGGQRNWLVEGSGGNGIVTNFFEGFGQQAYIGYAPPTNTVQSTTVWVPVNYTPAPPSAKIVKFSVTLQLYKSTVGGDDEFRWAVYNQDAKRLFSIDFFTDTQQVFFDLEDQQPVDTTYTFDYDGSYDLVAYMDFGRNQWTAFLNDRVIANAQPIRLPNSTSALNLGDVDAVWFVNNVQSPGDNFMVFDNYTITAEQINSIPVSIESIGVSPAGVFSFRVHGERGVKYAIDVTSDFVNWAQLYPGPGETFVNTDGTFVFEDTTSPSYNMGFYRVREVL